MSNENQVKISTGFKDLDKSIDGGFLPGSLICVGARPAMGKTSFLLNLSMSAEQLGIEYKFISMEQSPETLSKRTKNYVKQDRFCSSLRGIDQIRSYIETFEDKCKLFFIDGFNLIRSSSFTDVLEDISNNLHTLKALCMELEICIVFSCQLSRKVEERQGHRPRMTDLRDSGEIEEICDILLMILRRKYYDQQDKPGLAEIIVSKNRQGEIGTVNLNFSKEDLFSDFKCIIYTPIDKDDIHQGSFGAFMPS